MKHQITSLSQKTKFILRGVLIGIGFIASCVSLVWGIYLGDKYRETILNVERRVFGEKSAAVPLELDASGSVITSSSVEQDNSNRRPAVVDKARSAGEKAAATTKAQTKPSRSNESASSSKPDVEAHKPQVAAASNESDSTDKTDSMIGQLADAKGDETSLANLRMIPVTKHIKVLVADGYAASQSDWIAQTVRAVSTASRIYNAEFGIELRVVGVMRWLDALPDMTNEELLINLRKHPREGADMLLGFVDKELGGESYSQGAPARNSSYNGAYGLVGHEAESEPAFLRGVLRSVGHLLGAEQIKDTQNEAYRLGSWMSDARPPADRPPWIDMPNRKRILSRKSLPSWNPTDPVP